MQIKLTRQQAMNLATEIFRRLADDPAADVVVDVAVGDLRERLADLSHEIWSSWMRWMFEYGGQVVSHVDGASHWVMLPEKYARWQRQMNTEYGELSEREKDSDREQADKILAALGVQDSDKTADLWCSECNLRTDICQCPDWSNLPPGAVHVAGAVRDAKPTAQPYTHFRADGWPLCPACGQDELWSDAWATFSQRTMAEAIATIQGCYACHWSPELERDGN